MVPGSSTHDSARHLEDLEGLSGAQLREVLAELSDEALEQGVDAALAAAAAPFGRLVQVRQVSNGFLVSIVGGEDRVADSLGAALEHVEDLLKPPCRGCRPTAEDLER